MFCEQLCDQIVKIVVSRAGKSSINVDAIADDIVREIVQSSKDEVLQLQDEIKNNCPSGTDNWVKDQAIENCRWKIKSIISNILNSRVKSLSSGLSSHIDQNQLKQVCVEYFNNDDEKCRKYSGITRGFPLMIYMKIKHHLGGLYHRLMTIINQSAGNTEHIKQQIEQLKDQLIQQHSRDYINCVKQQIHTLVQQHCNKQSQNQHQDINHQHVQQHNNIHQQPSSSNNNDEYNEIDNMQKRMENMMKNMFPF